MCVDMLDVVARVDRVGDRAKVHEVVRMFGEVHVPYLRRDACFQISKQSMNITNIGTLLSRKNFAQCVM